MENRYKGNLRGNNQKLIALIPGGIKIRKLLGEELKKNLKENIKILEIGCGEGDSTKYLFEQNPMMKLDCLDISKEMIEIAKKTLEKYNKNINYICEDGLDYLKETKKNYDIITLSWTIHNFKWETKIKLLKIIFKNLNKKGKLLIMDKIYLGSKKKDKELLDLQCKRYENLEKDLNKEIINHEKQDFLDKYRMDEKKTFSELRKIGFNNIKILDRIERDVVLVAEKD